MAAEKTTTTETWLYAGVRVDDKLKTFHAWHDGTAILNFAKLPGSMPGHAYAIETIRDGDRVSVRGNPRYLAEQADRQATPAQLETWRAEHHAARQLVEAKRAEKAAGENDELQQALETIRRHRARIKSYAKRGAFDSYVLGELGRPPKATAGEED